MTVLLTPPDPDSVEAHCVGAETFDHPVEPASALKSEDPKTVGESWEVSDDPNVARYGGYWFLLACTLRAYLIHNLLNPRSSGCSDNQVTVC